MRRLSIGIFVALAAAQLGGCSSCLRDEEQPESKPIEPRAKQPSLTSKYRFQLREPFDASAE